jgi:intracellular septation protein A
MPDQSAAAWNAGQPHPLARVGKDLFSDLLSTVVFVGIYALTGNVYLSIGLGVTLGLGRIAWLKRRGVPIDPMMWMSLFLVVVFGGATLLTADPVFIKLKPTFIYAAIGIVMLRRGWMNRYLPPIAHVHGADLIVVFGYVWSALMFATSGANLAFALCASHAAWAWFIGVFPLASKIVLVAVQYTVLRIMVRRRIRSTARLAAL